MINLKHISIFCDENITLLELQEIRGKITAIFGGAKKPAVYMRYDSDEGILKINNNNEKERETDFQHENV